MVGIVNRGSVRRNSRCTGSEPVQVGEAGVGRRGRGSVVLSFLGAAGVGQAAVGAGSGGREGPVGGVGGCP